MEKKAERSQGIGPDLPGVVFLGTPGFAVPSLQRLIAAGADIRLVVSRPDRPSGRGKKVTPPAVKIEAEKLGIAVFQPDRVKGDETLGRIRDTGAELAIVVAFGEILPQAFLDLFPRGVINVHASLLPRLRGAAPVQRSILSGDTVTGVSIMLLDAGMDTGPVLSMSETPIGEEEPFGALYDRLALLGADLLVETLKNWRAGRVSPQPQDHAPATYAPPIGREEPRIDWRVPARQIVNTVRAFDPQPGAYALYMGKRVKLFGGRMLPWKAEGAPGEIIGSAEGGLVVLGGDGNALCVGELQWEGRRRLSAAEHLRGRPMPPGSRLE